GARSHPPARAAPGKSRDRRGADRQRLSVCREDRRGALAAGRLPPHLGHAGRPCRDRRRLDRARGRRSGARHPRDGKRGRATSRLAWSLARFLVRGVVLAAGGGGGGSTEGVAGARKTIAASGRDWPRFGWDARRSNDDPNATGITAANVSSLV